MSEYKIPIEEVEKFLLGHDDEKYIVNIEYDNKTNLIYKFKQLPDGTKTTEKEPLKAFLWMKNLNTLKERFNFYDNNTLKIKLAREQYGIEIKSLGHGDHERLVNGYKYLLTCDQGYDRMLEFFRKGGFYRGIYDKTNDINTHFMILPPVEQYLISTGKRLYKGYEDYNDIEKFVFDLETTGLDPETSRIFLIGCKTNKDFEVLFDCETEGENADATEVAAIAKFFAAIDYIKPAIIGGYNSANFDWNFIFKRCEKLGIDITEEHRLARLQPRKLPYVYRSTLVEDGRMISKDYSNQHGIVPPRLYSLGLGHNNCGGFCPKAGVGHYAKLLTGDRQQYMKIESMEQDVYDTVPNARPFLRWHENGKITYNTLKDFRMSIEKQGTLLNEDDSMDFGGCGCAI